MRAIMAGGVTAGALDGLDAVLFYGLYAGVSPLRLFQHIASGLIGRAAFHGGWASMVLGVILHFAVATGAAAVYFLASRRIPILRQKPFVSGPAFGIAVFLVMNHVVVPLSAVAARRAAMSSVELADQLFSHMFLVGLPIALFVRRAARLDCDELPTAGF